MKKNVVKEFFFDIFYKVQYIKPLFIYKYFVITIIFTILILFSCSSKDEEIVVDEKAKQDSIKKAIQDSIAKWEEKIKADSFPTIKYEKIYLANKKIYDEISKRFSGEKRRVLTTLNRKEFGFIRIGDSIIVPDTIILDLRAYSIFPIYYPSAREIPKIILVSNLYQCYACYEYGRLVRFAAANTGKETTPTYPGRYSLYWKQYLRRSSLDSHWVMPFTFNFHLEGGFAFHQFTMPGRPVSHSCVRQFREDAEWLFKWGEQAKLDSNKRYIPFSGTPVIILDYFNFERKKYGNWIDLTSNKQKVIDLPQKPLEVEEALIPIIQIPKESRGMLRNKERYLYAEDTLRARGVIRPHVKLTPSINFNQLRRQKAKQALKEKQSRPPKDSINGN